MLRKGQKELVNNYRGGYVAVPAIPGGGKTHSLSKWAVEVISEGLNKPGKILIVTYMNSAVNNFKQRIAKELSNRGINSNKDYTVSTIHGLCHRIIRERPDSLLAGEEFEIIDDTMRYQLMENSVCEWKNKNEDKFLSFIDSVYLQKNSSQVSGSWQEKLTGVMLSAIGDIKLTGLTPSELLHKCNEAGKTALLNCTAEIYELYDFKLKKQGFLDFNDMLYYAKKILQEDRELLEKYRRKYTFVCEDEAQDSNLIQSEILQMIANGNLLRVGDSNQAICGSFTSSDFKFFKEFASLPQTIVYNITESSRSSRAIIDLANFFVSYVIKKHPVIDCRNSLLPQYIEPVSEADEYPNPVIPEYGIKADIYKSWDEEIYKTVAEVQNILLKYPLKSAAILVPSYKKINELTEVLESKNVEYEQLDSTSAERSKAIRLLGRVIDFIANPEDGKKLYHMASECFLTGVYEDIRSISKDNSNYKILKQADLLKSFLCRYSVYKLLYPVAGGIKNEDIPKELIESRIWSDFLGLIPNIKEMLDFPCYLMEELILFISDKLGFDKEERAISCKVAADAGFMRKQSSSFSLADLSYELMAQKSIFSYFSGVVWDLKGYEPKPGIVTVATYHKAKGLEWDNVFLTSINYSDFPVLLEDKFIGEYWFLKQEFKNPQAIIKAELETIQNGISSMDSILKSKLETISEKARLLYVGITRAKERLFLSGFNSEPGKKNGTKPSGYLTEIKAYIEEVSENGNKS